MARAVWAIPFGVALPLTPSLAYRPPCVEGLALVLIAALCWWRMLPAAGLLAYWLSAGGGVLSAVCLAILYA